MSTDRLMQLLNQKVRFWRAEGFWYCAVPHKQNELMQMMGVTWQTHGLIGFGKTAEAAFEDWEKWQRAFYVVEDLM